jgi:hypothetical protein
MKIKYEDYPLLSGKPYVVDRDDLKKYSQADIETVRDLVHGNNLEVVYFTNPIKDLVLKNYQKIVETASDAEFSGRYCFLFKDGVSVYFDASSKIIERKPYLGGRVATFGADVLASFNDQNDLCIAIAFYLFYKYADVETVVLDKIQRKQKIFGVKYFNETQSVVKIIDSAWARNIIQTEGFNVRGHFAFRWIGEGRRRKRLVWINEFQKEGYNRKAGILRNE